MIKAEINRGEVSMEISGSLRMITTEAATMIGSLYEDLMHDSGPAAAELFRGAFTACVVNPKSHMWELQDEIPDEEFEKVRR